MKPVKGEEEDEQEHRALQAMKEPEHSTAETTRRQEDIRGLEM